MSIEMDWSAVYELAADLGAAGDKAQGLAEQVVAKSAMDVEAHAKTLAPVDTGNLRSSITATVGDLKAEIGPTANYGAFVEYGTYKMSPQPYMGPAVDRVEPTFLAAMGQIADGIL